MTKLLLTVRSVLPVGLYLAGAATAAAQTESKPNVLFRVSWKGKRVRALHLWGQDAVWLEVIGRGEFALNGFRNRDLRRHLFAFESPNPETTRRHSGQVTRRLRLLRAHGLIKKVPRTHRYLLTDKGRAVIVALSAARNASPRQLTELAA